MYVWRERRRALKKHVLPRASLHLDLNRAKPCPGEERGTYACMRAIDYYGILAITQAETRVCLGLYGVQ